MDYPAWDRSADRDALGEDGIFRIGAGKGGPKYIVKGSNTLTWLL